MATVLLLGAASDMAMAIARRFAAEGFDLQLAARRVNRLIPFQSDLKIRYNNSCTLHEFDAFAPAEHVNFFNNLPVKPDISICVFGYLGEQEKAIGNWEEASRILNANYTGAVSILNIIGSYYESVQRGTIVGISSVAGDRGRQSNFMYGSAKAGFTAYLSGLRNRLYHKGVHVITVKPGFVYTRMTEELHLPGLLTATPERVATCIFRAVQKKKNVVYVKWFWRWIMLIIKFIPEFIFKKLRL